MFQGGELIIILLVALVVFGPARLPDLARRAGGYANELRKAARELRSGLESEVSDLKTAGDAFKSAGEEIRAMGADLKSPFDEVKKDIDEVGVSRLDWTGPKPISGPTPADAMADLDRIEIDSSTASGAPFDAGDEEE